MANLLRIDLVVLVLVKWILNGFLGVACTLFCVATFPVICCWKNVVFLIVRVLVPGVYAVLEPMDVIVCEKSGGDHCTVVVVVELDGVVGVEKLATVFSEQVVPFYPRLSMVVN